ncbi:lipoprotein-releasing system ATP-binding protein [Skermanella aerolata]|uniref:ATP-binding protein n=1 Tax=Skermanella aerolata TaxID=393310 RepID=A0A512DUM6_9PROT|nr:ABC transporter ATP-binding protein [Skermanella aerolata]KJB95099.1 ATP-binding protein [Skermanella aerolata KACC 11604]GEO40173.1 ATP-binding protein [Skermanella aerolata]
MTAAVVEARGIGRVLPGPVPVTLVEGIDLSIGEGEFVAITGPSGSGKSSLLYLLGLLDRPTSGTVILEGRDTAEADAAELAALRLSKLGFVFQFHFLLPEFTVLGNVMIPMRKLGGSPEAELRTRAQALLEDLGLGDQAAKLPSQLSGGQRQRVAIARALANRPRVILADEPTGNLDTKSAQTVFDIFARLARETGTTVITVTHDEGLAAQTSRRVNLVDGRLVTPGVR